MAARFIADFVVINTAIIISKHNARTTTKAKTHNGKSVAQQSQIFGIIHSRTKYERNKGNGHRTKLDDNN